MKYLCLIYLEETTLHAMPQSERVALSNESMAYCDELQKKTASSSRPRRFTRWRPRRRCGCEGGQSPRPMGPLPKRRNSWAGIF